MTVTHSVTHVAGECPYVGDLPLWVSIQIREVWNTYELDLVNYQNKCRLIRGWDDLFNKVKEHINSVSAMKLSPYYKVCCGASLPHIHRNAHSLAGMSLAVQWLRLQASTAGSTGSIPGQGAKTPSAAWPK